MQTEFLTCKLYAIVGQPSRRALDDLRRVYYENDPTIPLWVILYGQYEGKLFKNTVVTILANGSEEDLFKYLKWEDDTKMYSVALTALARKTVRATE